MGVPVWGEQGWLEVRSRGSLVLKKEGVWGRRKAGMRLQELPGSRKKGRMGSGSDSIRGMQVGAAVVEWGVQRGPGTGKGSAVESQCLGMCTLYQGSHSLLAIRAPLTP